MKQETAEMAARLWAEAESQSLGRPLTAEEEKSLLQEALEAQSFGSGPQHDPEERQI